MNSSSSNLTPTQEKLILSALFIILFALEVVVVQHFFTSVVAGANDFYSRWYGAKAWILEGRDPYGLDVTAEIMPKLGFGPEEAARAAFAYPLPVVFTFWPLVYLPYDWTQAFWWVTVQWLAVGMAMGLLAWKRLQPRPLTMAAIILAMLFFYPVTRTIFLGQFTVHVAFLVIMTLVMLERGRDGWAGIFLSATSIKPQMVILIGPWLVLWAIGQRRWRFLGGLLGGGAGLFLTSWALFPRWPISFFEEIQRYQQVAGGRNPLSLLLATLWPSYPPHSLDLVLGFSGGRNALHLVAGVAENWPSGRKSFILDDYRRYVGDVPNRDDQLHPADNSLFCLAGSGTETVGQPFHHPVCPRRRSSSLGCFPGYHQWRF